MANRSIRIERVPTDLRAGKVTITGPDGLATSYIVRRIETQLGGVAFQLDKIETEYDSDEPGVLTMRVGERYSVLLNGRESTCDCKWGTYGGHKKPCRHVAGLLKLHAEGRLS